MLEAKSMMEASAEACSGGVIEWVDHFLETKHRSYLIYSRDFEFCGEIILILVLCMNYLYACCYASNNANPSFDNPYQIFIRNISICGLAA